MLISVSLRHSKTGNSPIEGLLEQMRNSSLSLLVSSKHSRLSEVIRNFCFFHSDAGKWEKSANFLGKAMFEGKTEILHLWGEISKARRAEIGQLVDYSIPEHDCLSNKCSVSQKTWLQKVQAESRKKPAWI